MSTNGATSAAPPAGPSGGLTPTSDTSFDMADTEPSPASHHDLTEHQTLYIRDDMVKIRVENTLFRIPTYVLTHGSAHFAALLKDHDPSAVLHLQDADISASSFASFLAALLPRLDAAPPPTPAQWMDVLALSSKWGFANLRTASLAALTPFASPVDKIVLARAFGIPDWLPGAYADLFERAESLSLEEARRIPLEDVVAIAHGRCDARPASVRPRAQIEATVTQLLSPSNTGSPARVDPDDTARMVARWLAQLEADGQADVPAPTAQALAGISDQHWALMPGLERSIIEYIVRNPGSDDGAHIAQIARAVRGTAVDISNAVDALLDKGYIYSTVDESHFMITN